MTDRAEHSRRHAVSAGHGPAPGLGHGREAPDRPTAVLLIEDSSEYAELVDAMLDEAWPHTLHLVHRPRLTEGIEYLAHHTVGCVLLDLGLPDAEGLAALSQLKGMAAEIPVVVLTGRDDALTAVQAVQEGAQDYLIKSRSNGTLISRAVRYAMERKQSELDLAHQAMHDALTGVPNRTLFADRLTVALARARRLGSEVAVLFLDLDGFKRINDSLGHNAGDRVLVEVAQRLTAAVRPNDTIARFGGDEFVILCEDAGNADQAIAFASQLGEAITVSFHLDGRALHLTPSIGIALSEGPDICAQDLVRDADAAMYRAKERLGVSYELFDPTMHSRAILRLDLEADLHRALEHDEFVLHYQPQVDLRTGALVGLEALVRWQHPGRGMVPLDQFVGVAESCGLIVALGEWVIGEACRQAGEWGLQPGPGSPSLSVNLSARQLAQSDLSELVARHAATADIDPGVLIAELTETSVLRSDTETTTALARLRALGLRLSLDDFGTGYASLSVLAELCLHEVKIDREFVAEMLVNSHKHAIVTAIAVLADSLGLSAVAEGIETAKQLAECQRLGIHVGQGYLFSRPQAPEVLDEWLEESHRFLLPGAPIRA